MSSPATARSLALGREAFDLMPCGRCHPTGAEAAAAASGGGIDLASLAPPLGLAPRISVPDATNYSQQQAYAHRGFRRIPRDPFSTRLEGLNSRSRRSEDRRNGRDCNGRIHLSPGRHFRRLGVDPHCTGQRPVLLGFSAGLGRGRRLLVPVLPRAARGVGQPAACLGDTVLWCRRWRHPRHPSGDTREPRNGTFQKEQPAPAINPGASPSPPAPSLRHLGRQR